MTLPGRTADRLHLLLAILAWLVPRRSVRIDEIGQRFDLSDADVIEIVELAACCGIPPYTADVLLDVYVDGETVQANLAGLMRRPRRLSAPEGFAVAASARAVLGVPGADPDGSLRSALEKLETVLGERSALTVQIDGPDLLVDVRRAAEDTETIEIEYYSASRDELTRRRVDPFHVFSVGGHWYVDAHCHSAGSVRHFRVDRIRSVVPTGEHFRASEAGDSEFFLGAPDVVVAVPTASRWMIDTLATRSVRDMGDGFLRVTMPMAGVPWLERLLLVLGPEASVVEPVELRDAGREAAWRLLARYG